MRLIDIRIKCLKLQGPKDIPSRACMFHPHPHPLYKATVVPMLHGAFFDARWCTCVIHVSPLSAVQEVIKSKFDAEKLDSVLRSRSHTPSWVTGLTSDRIGRQLIYDLSGVHKNSLMLNFAVQKILADGHDQEVTVCAICPDRLTLLDQNWAVHCTSCTNGLESFPDYEISRDGRGCPVRDPGERACQPRAELDHDACQCASPA